jgi:cytochrome c biogenesis protein CcmG/thiol:disulfide interchange protein DsbE
MRPAQPLVGVVVLAAMLTVGPALEPRTVPSPLVGKPAPALALPRLADPARTAPAGEAMKGQVWLLNVWASWCAPCREEHPVLVAAARASGVPIVGLNYKDDRRAAAEWLIRFGDPYVATLTDRDGGASLDWGVHGVPETFVVDRAGIVRFRHAGPVTPELWATRIAPLLRELQG